MALMVWQVGYPGCYLLAAVWLACHHPAAVWLACHHPAAVWLACHHPATVWLACHHPAAVWRVCHHLAVVRLGCHWLLLHHSARLLLLCYLVCLPLHHFGLVRNQIRSATHHHFLRYRCTIQLHCRAHLHLGSPLCYPAV